MILIVTTLAIIFFSVVVAERISFWKRTSRMRSQVFLVGSNTANVKSRIRAELGGGGLSFICEQPLGQKSPVLGVKPKLRLAPSSDL